jgi:3-hydroxyacyl-[acyl-carrier-protein] dehydratase
MPLNELVDLKSLDLSRIVITRETIYSVLAHRHEFMLLDGLLHYSPASGIAVGYHDVRPDEFWCRGHIPGNPLMPGVLIVEAAGQVCGYYFDREMTAAGGRFFGFVGVDEVRFRGIVRPGERLTLVSKVKHMRPTSGIFETQAYVDGKVVYDGIIKGMCIPTSSDR